MASRVVGFFRCAVGVVAELVMVGWVVCVARVGVGQVADPLAPPANRVGVREEVRFVALVGGTVHVGPGRVVEGGTVVLRGGLVEGVLEAGVGVPAGAEVRDVRGRYVYPALIDAYVEVDGPALSIDGPGAHWSPVVFKDGGDGTVADLRTGLTWTKDPPWRAPIGRLKPRPKRAEQAGIELPGVLGKMGQERAKGEGGDEVARVDRPAERKA
ncbi:MAG: hypothetical protein ACK54T_03220 [bacterium]